MHHLALRGILTSSAPELEISAAVKAHCRRKPAEHRYLKAASQIQERQQGGYVEIRLTTSITKPYQGNLSSALALDIDFTSS